MAHETQVIGKISEMTAARALMHVGWEIAQPVVPEVYDLVGRDPANGQFQRIQVKTCRVREDRDGAIVVYARKGNGSPYTPQECELIAGVLGEKVYMFECRGLSEYWSTQETASKRWVELTATEEGVKAC